MIYEKTEQRKKAQMNLENCRYLGIGKLPPPLTAHKRNAVRVSPTAKNSRTVSFLHRIHSSVAFLLCVIKGKPLRDGWYITSGSDA